MAPGASSSTPINMSSWGTAPLWPPINGLYRYTFNNSGGYCRLPVHATSFTATCDAGGAVGASAAIRGAKISADRSSRVFIGGNQRRVFLCLDVADNCAFLPTLQGTHGTGG